MYKVKIFKIYLKYYQVYYRIVETLKKKTNRLLQLATFWLFIKNHIRKNNEIRKNYKMLFVFKGVICNTIVKLLA